MSEPEKEASSFWLTPLTFVDQPLCVEVGDLLLWISRQTHEWRLHYHWTRKGSDGAFNYEFAAEPEAQNGTLERIAMANMPTGVTLRPLLAERSIVVRPYAPLTLPAGHGITLYVSTPLWLGIDFSGQMLKELPVQQLSDTWMGSLTGAGELCYGSQSHARLDSELLPRLPYRALTPVTMCNKGADNFVLERLSIPAPHLSLFQGEGQLHTESLTITMETETHQGIVEIGKPDDGALVAPPRLHTDRGILVKAWENLFA